MAEHYEVMIIGGGTAGLRAALQAAHYKKVVLIESGILGGTCLNNGCIPTKAMLEGAHRYAEALNLEKFGIATGKVTLKFNSLMDRVRGIVASGQKHITASIAKSNLTVVTGEAVFVKKNTVEVGDRTLSAHKVLIATGAVNFVPPVKGLDKVSYISNENMLKLRSLPKSVIMIGGGYIAMELATFFSALGSTVTVIERHHHVLGMLDHDVSELLAEYYAKAGVRFVLDANILEVRDGKRGKEVVVNDVKDLHSKKKVLRAEKLVVAVGRIPNTRGLNLSAGGIKVGKRGEIIVNKKMQTSCKNVYACGDVTGLAMFAHTAKIEEGVALHNLLHRDQKKADLRYVPWAVFTHPVISGVGLSEREAHERGYRVGILQSYFSQVGRAHVMDDSRGFVKVMYNKKNHHILGCVMIGIRADDLIHEITALLNSSSPTIDVLRKTIHAHPTISEVMSGLHEVK